MLVMLIKNGEIKMVEQLHVGVHRMMEVLISVKKTGH